MLQNILVVTRAVLDYLTIKASGKYYEHSCLDKTFSSLSLSVSYQKMDSQTCPCIILVEPFPVNIPDMAIPIISFSFYEYSSAVISKNSLFLRDEL